MLIPSFPPRLEAFDDPATRRPAEFRGRARRVGLLGGGRLLRTRRLRIDVAGRRIVDGGLFPRRRSGRFRLGDDRLRRRRRNLVGGGLFPRLVGGLVRHLFGALVGRPGLLVSLSGFFLFAGLFGFVRLVGLRLRLLRAVVRSDFGALFGRRFGDRLGWSSFRDGAAAAGAVDRNHQMHAALDFRGARKAVGAHERG